MKVLIVSNDRALLRHVSRFLTTFGYETIQVADYQRAAEVLESLTADLLIVDSEPDFDKALEFCRTASGRESTSSLHTLLLVGRDSMHRLTESLEAGADDFLAKPVVYGEVLMRLRAGARAVEFQRRTRQQRRREPVTGLLSRAALHARLQAAGSSGASRSSQFACVMLDVDFIDRVGCRFGRHGADDLLRDVGALLERLCENDRADLAHFGGGEFCVVLPGTTTTQAVQWAEAVRSEVAGHEFLVGDVEVPLTVSIGVSGTDTLAMSAEAVLAKARQALQSAQASGHDCVVQHDQYAEEEMAWKELAAPGRLFERTVARDVMLPTTLVLHAADEIRIADSLFRQTHLTNLVVVDQNERLVGTVSFDDVAEFLQASGDPAQPISRVMIRDVDVVDEDMDFAELMVQFAHSDSELVVVVGDDRPSGLVTTASLASLSQTPERPAFCTESPSMQSSYLQVAELLDSVSSAGTS